jgi:hypothetical protein
MFLARCVYNSTGATVVLHFLYQIVFILCCSRCLGGYQYGEVPMFCQCTYNPVHDAFYLVLSDTNPLAGIAAGAIATILICEPTILLPQLLAFPTLCLADVGIQQLPPCALAFLCTFDPSRQLGPLTSQLLWSSMTHLPSALPPPHAPLVCIVAPSHLCSCSGCCCCHLLRQCGPVTSN